MTNDLAQFLRDRYAEQRARENGKRRQIPSTFDDHDVAVIHAVDGATLMVDGQPYPEADFLAIATEPAADPAVLADLDAKLAIVDHYEQTAEWYAAPENRHQPAGEVSGLREALKLLTRPFAGHPDYREEWTA